MSERKSLVTRVVSVIAATVIALACGTNVSTPHLRYSLSVQGLINFTVCLFGVGPSIRRADEVLIHSKQSYRQSRLGGLKHQLKVRQGTFGNLGMYGGGIPVGMLVDAKGPTPGVILGGSLLGSGYFAMHRGVSAYSTVSPSLKFQQHL